MNTFKGTLKVYHTGDSYKVSQILALTKSDKFNTVAQNICDDPLSGTQLLTLCNKLHISVEELVDKDSEIYKTSLKKSSFDDADWLQMLTAHPKLIKTPIVEKGNKVIIIKTPTDVLKLKDIDKAIDGHNHIK